MKSNLFLNYVYIVMGAVPLFVRNRTEVLFGAWHSGRQSEDYGLYLTFSGNQAVDVCPSPWSLKTVDCFDNQVLIGIKGEPGEPVYKK